MADVFALAGAERERFIQAGLSQHAPDPDYLITMLDQWRDRFASMQAAFQAMQARAEEQQRQLEELARMIEAQQSPTPRRKD